MEGSVDLMICRSVELPAARTADHRIAFNFAVRRLIRLFHNCSKLCNELGT